MTATGILVSKVSRVDVANKIGAQKSERDFSRRPFFRFGPRTIDNTNLSQVQVWFRVEISSGGVLTCMSGNETFTRVLYLLCGFVVRYFDYSSTPWLDDE